MAKIANHMTRIVLIGTLESGELNDKGNMYKGSLKVKDQNIQFVIFNNDKETAQNPHTKATDFSEQYKKGDKVFITGTDARNYSAEKDTYYESVQVWDYRAADEAEVERYVFVYVGDVSEINDNETIINFINYRDETMQFPLNMEKAKGDSYEVGDRIKVKGELFNGMKLDFYGDGEFVTERNVVEVKRLNTLEEIEEDAKPASEEDGMWD